MKQWTKEEEQILLKNYYDYSNRELNKLFFPDRSPKSIERKIFRMNLGPKSPEVRKRGIQKMSNTKKEYYKDHEAWNKGRTFSKESKQKMSQAKKAVGKWKGKDNPRHQKPLFGKENGNWQGGVTDLYRALRNELNCWYQKSINICNYKCVITGEDFEELHHFYPFRKIMNQVFDNLNMEIRSSQNDYSEIEWPQIKEELLRLHFLYGYGVCLTQKIHMFFHENYGYHNCTSQDFLEFVYKIDCGDYDNWFKRNNININLNYSYIEYLESTLVSQKSA